MILILGGTSEARQLAEALTKREVRVVSSLAGRVARPRLPVGEVRVGGFGGPEGLALYLRENRVEAVVDATHPFAERIGTNAAKAAELTKTPLLRLARPGWRARVSRAYDAMRSCARSSNRLPPIRPPSE